MPTRAKFKLESSTQRMGNDGLTTEWLFRAVQSSENAEWSKYTPYGELKLATTKLPVDHFKLGKEYYADITECD